jgi:hypothetical protein
MLVLDQQCFWRHTICLGELLEDPGGMPLVDFFEFWHFIRPLVLSSRSQDGPTVSIRAIRAHHAASPPLLSSQRHIEVTYSVRADVLVLELAPGQWPSPSTVLLLPACTRT